MTTYYRFTGRENPMSDWGHAMFADDRDRVEFYGDHEFRLEEGHCVSIYDLEAAITEAWTQDPCAEYAHLDAAQAFDEFCPEDIVNGAQAYDCELVCWLWEHVLDRAGIMAVKTRDGAICFDSDLIEEVA